MTTFAVDTGQQHPPRPPLIFVRNNQQGPTVFSKPDVSWRGMWAPAGDPTGKDLLRVPSYLLDDPDFLDSVERGVLEIEDATDPAVAGYLQRHRETNDRMLASQRARQEAVLDRRQDRDIAGEHCVGPGQRGRSAECGTSVLRPAAAQKDSPPLCSVHEHLSDQYVLVRAGSAGDPTDPVREAWVFRSVERPRDLRA
jgi:hypothetical protein